MTARASGCSSRVWSHTHAPQGPSAPLSSQQRALSTCMTSASAASQQPAGGGLWLLCTNDHRCCGKQGDGKTVRRSQCLAQRRRAATLSRRLRCRLMPGAASPPQEPGLPGAGVRAVRAEPEPAVRRQLQRQVPQRRRTRGALRGAHPAGGHRPHDRRGRQRRRAGRHPGRGAAPSPQAAHRRVARKTLGKLVRGWTGRLAALGVEDPEPCGYSRDWGCCCKQVRIES